MSERLRLEEQHHNKLHEPTCSEIIEDLTETEEERSTVREEISQLIGEFVTKRAGKSAKELEKQNEENYQAYLRGEYPDPRD